MIEIETSSTAEFMRALLITEPHFPGNQNNTWYFRGQADARWGLVPSLRRKRSWERLGGAERLGLICSTDKVIGPDDKLRSVEISLLRTLLQVIDRMGLPPALREGYALAAFAQHIGLPTRMLDWTRSPWTAAYFATSEAARHIGEDGKLVVFALSSLFLQHSGRMTGVEKVDLGAAGNPNLLAQQGVLLRLGDDQVDLLEGLKFEQRPVGYRPSVAEAALLDHHLIRLSLPWSEAEMLLRTLRNQELHAATIYPGQTGVGELVREVFLSTAILNSDLNQ